MRLWCWPGATFELGQLKVLVAPPDRMAALLEVPEIVTFHTRYLHHGLSEVLFRVPPIRSEHFEAMACATLDELTAASQVVVPHGPDGRVGPGARGRPRGRGAGPADERGSRPR